MSQNLQNNYQVENEINLQETFNLLVESKKTLMLTILFFVSLSFLYSIFSKPSIISTAIVEIGSQNMSDGSLELIEESSDLITDLKINFFYKTPSGTILDSLDVNSIEKRLVQIELKSKSFDLNEKTLMEILDYINQKHNRLLNLKRLSKQKKISNQIELLKSEKTHYREVIKSYQTESSRIDFSSQIDIMILKLEADLKYIENEIALIEEIIYKDKDNLILLQPDTKLENQSISKESILERSFFENKSQILELMSQKSILINEILNLESTRRDLFSGNIEDDLALLEIEQKIKLFESQLNDLQLQTSSISSVIGEIETVTSKPNVLLMIIIGIIIGSTVGVFLVNLKKFINDSKDISLKVN